MAESVARPLRLAVVGGGLSGLTAAYRLQELARQADRPVELTLFEASPQTGGIVGTIRRDGYLVDVGADSFITNKPAALRLCQRLGIEDRLATLDPRYRGALVLHEGRPVPVPDGFQLLSPSAFWPMVRTPLLSLWGKLRMGMELFVPPRRSSEDESLADFVRRRFGREALERLIQPLVGGIYTADPEKLSMQATLGRFVEMEQKYGSVIRGSRRQLKEQHADSDSSSTGARYGLFLGLKGGLQDLVDALTQAIQPSVQVRTGIRLTTAVEEPTGVRLENGATDGPWDGVVLAMMAHQAAALVERMDGDLAGALRSIEYASSAIVVSGHKLAEFREPPQAFGLVIPHREHRRILAVSFSSRKFADRAPEGGILLRTFIGGALQQHLFERSDEELLQIVREELQEIFGVSTQWAQVIRYANAMPQYHVGHLQRVARIEELAAQHPRLALTGNAYHGVGVPDVIQQAEDAADRLWRTVTAIKEDEEVLPRRRGGRGEEQAGDDLRGK
ncbi:protoporphyrinogen oxidase [Planctellipticum variicoloris]|uniref:protoporphyrinogen oxidase n=1 Tax=Planctellipticum variicoloris TaxID=3064265 RepID=UPI003013E5B5|nr:protoporphyrinogen oxidase [Planctomycetaceae bacterium SH412]